MSGSDLRFLEAVSPLPAPFLPLPSANGIFPITRWQIGQSTQLSLKVFAAGMLQCQLPFVHADQPLNDRFLVAALRRRAPPSMSDFRGSESVSAISDRSHCIKLMHAHLSPRATRFPGSASAPRCRRTLCLARRQ